MKRVLAILLSCTLLLTACASSNTNNENAKEKEEVVEQTSSEEKEDKNVDDGGESLEEIAEGIKGLDDPALLQVVKDEIAAGIEASLDSEDYILEDVQATYISKEYLEELAYNSKDNIYFGYTLDEIEAQFDGGEYVFTVDDNGKTIVTAYQDYDDTYEQIVKNVAIGTGVILICATVSVVTAGAGAPAAVTMVFAASAKTGATFALSSAAFSGVIAGVATGIKEKDFSAATKAAALAGSEGFKWGAITGVITGGVSEAITIKNAANAAKNTAEVVDVIPSWRDSELYVLEEYGGTEQVTFLAGEEVPFGTPGATRPDVLREVDGALEAIEVKNYNLNSARSCETLYSELERQITQRVKDLPPGTAQRIVLDTRGRTISPERVETVTKTITEILSDVYPNIPIDVLGV